MIRTLVILIALTGGTTAAQSAMLCRETKGADGWWTWRLVDDRKCWYPGRVVRERSELTWNLPGETGPFPKSEPSEPPVTIVPTRTLTDREIDYARGVELLKAEFSRTDH